MSPDHFEYLFVWLVSLQIMGHWDEYLECSGVVGGDKKKTGSRNPLWRAIPHRYVGGGHSLPPHRYLGGVGIVGVGDLWCSGYSMRR